ncbi:MAG: hypothetical protein JWM02_533 [Frankiales bacterium]|nr:hypothetical protein [Frankiales bacterium]
MTVQDDASAARQAVRALDHAVKALTGHFGDSVDARRLKVDAERVAQDVELLCGRELTPPPEPSPGLQVIDDTVYPQEFWMDAEDEGLGGGR